MTVETSELLLHQNLNAIIRKKGRLSTHGIDIQPLIYSAEETQCFKSVSSSKSGKINRLTERSNLVYFDSFLGSSFMPSGASSLSLPGLPFAKGKKGQLTKDFSLIVRPLHGLFNDLNFFFSKEREGEV